MQPILLAAEEPKLYQLLFMDRHGKTRGFDEALTGLGETAIIQKDYGLSAQETKELFPMCGLIHSASERCAPPAFAILQTRR